MRKVLELLSIAQIQFNNEVWLSLVERCVRDAEAAGSNPVASTKNPCFLYGKHGFFMPYSLVNA